MLPLFPCLKQIADGMEQLHLISLVRKKPNFFYNLFCNQNKFRWDFETVEDSIRPNFSASGSNKREKEIDSYKSFIDCLEKIYHDEGIITILTILIINFFSSITILHSITP